MAEREDPVMHRDELTAFEPALDQAIAQPELGQLAVADYPVLPFGDPSDRQRGIDPVTRIKFSSYFLENLMRMPGGG